MNKSLTNFCLQLWLAPTCQDTCNQVPKGITGNTVSDVMAWARPGYRGLGPAFKSSGLRKGQARALGQIYLKPGLGSGLGHGLAA